MTTFNIFSKRANTINGIDIYGANIPEDIVPGITYDPFKGPQCTFTNKVTGSAKSIPAETMFDLICVPIKNKRRVSFKRLRINDVENNNDETVNAESKKKLMNMTKVSLDCSTMFSYRICVDRMTYVIMAVRKHDLVTVATIHHETDLKDRTDSERSKQAKTIDSHTDMMFYLEL